MKSRLDIDVLGSQEALDPGPVFFHDHQTQTAVILNVPRPGDQLKPGPVLLEHGFGVHGFMGRVK